MNKPSAQNTMYLLSYVATYNKMAVLFGDVYMPALPEDPATWTQRQVKQLLDRVECELSPENLTCDGELRRALGGKSLKQKATMLRGVESALKALVVS